MKIIQNSTCANTKVTLVCCVHGNEKFGKTVFDYFLARLDKYAGLTLVLANEEAMKLNKRYIDTDLNRSFPGVVTSSKHEENLAAQIKQTIDPKSIIIDIHTTITRLKAICLVTNLSSQNMEVLNSIAYKEVAHMKQGFGSLISQYDRAVSLEYNREYAKKPVVLKTIEEFLQQLLGMQKGKYTDKVVYESIGKLPINVHIPKNPKDFYYLVDRDSYVLFPKTRAANGFKGFEMKRVDC